MPIDLCQLPIKIKSRKFHSYAQWGFQMLLLAFVNNNINQNILVIDLTTNAFIPSNDDANSCSYTYW